MHTALYFPHAEVRSKNIIHDALLLWDRLEYIAPYHGYQPDYADAESAEAMELIGEKRVPSEREKQDLHALISELVDKGVPEIFQYSPSSGERQEAYEIWPQKLLDQTWELLRAKGLTDRALDNCDYPMSQAAGLSIMAILADVLAGDTRTRITDRSLAYATIANAPKVASDAEAPMRIVPLTLEMIAVDRLPINKLIAFRKREEIERFGSHYRKLRHQYLDAIQEHAATIANVAPNSKDRTELDRVFQARMKDDLRDLKHELGFARNDAWLSKDVITLAIAGATLLGSATIPDMPIPQVVTGAGTAALLGGVVGTGNRFAKSRYDILRKHPTAYLYEIGP
jgi:hypothetical protein